MSQIDVKHPLRIVALDASIGRIASLQGSPKKGPESAPKPLFRCDRPATGQRQAVLLLTPPVPEVHSSSKDLTKKTL